VDVGAGSDGRTLSRRIWRFSAGYGLPAAFCRCFWRCWRTRSAPGIALPVGERPRLRLGDVTEIGDFLLHFPLQGHLSLQVWVYLVLLAEDFSLQPSLSQHLSGVLEPHLFPTDALFARLKS
jgi:hypothetical protein